MYLLRSIILYIFLFGISFIGLLSAQNAPMFPIKQDYKYGLMDIEGHIRADIRYDNIGPCINRSYYIFSQNGLMGLLDHSGKEIIAAQYKFMNHACDDLFSVKKEGRWQVINPSNEVVLDSVPGKIQGLGQGYYTYSSLTGIGLLHIQKGKVAPAIYYDIQRIDSAYFIIELVERVYLSFLH